MVVRSKSQARSQTAAATPLLGYGSVAGARALEGGEKSPRLGFLTLRCSRTKLRFSCCCPRTFLVRFTAQQVPREQAFEIDVKLKPNQFPVSLPREPN
jgi:hypothetical protein